MKLQKINIENLILTTFEILSTGFHAVSNSASCGLPALVEKLYVVGATISVVTGAKIVKTYPETCGAMIIQLEMESVHSVLSLDMHFKRKIHLENSVHVYSERNTI